jgi:hypothetical protein
MGRIHRGFGGATFAAAVVALAVLGASPAPATAAGGQSKKPFVPGNLAKGPDAWSQDIGDVAVVVDNGLMVTSQDRFDLSFPTTLRFDPAGPGKFTVSRSAASFDTSFGPELTFGYPGATLWPGDDDSQEVAFAAGFPWFGTTYSSVFVNTDGNVTLGEADFSSSPRDKARVALGAPRIAAFLHDWNPGDALNPDPTKHGSIHAVVKSDPARLVATWNGVADFEGGVSSTFQITLFATGAVEITFTSIDTPAAYGVVGISQGRGQGAIRQVDYSTQSAGQAIEAGTIVEAFAPLTQVDEQVIAKEFYKSHPDEFDYLVIMTDFSSDAFIHHYQISNQTHGIGTPLTNGRDDNPSTVYDHTAQFGSAGELEQVLGLNNIFLYPSSANDLVNPVIEPYRSNSNVVDAPATFGRPVTLDGQTMSQDRITGTLPPDGGEVSRYFARDGSYSIWLSSAMAMTFHEVMHRWGAYVRFVHPTKGTGFDSFDLLGIDTQHWSYFLNTAVPGSQFADAPRSSLNLGNQIVDLGRLSTFNGAAISLDPGESVFQTPATELIDGCSALDQYLMGLRRADEVGPFFYVDEPKSVLTGAALDPFNAPDPLDRAFTMRAWMPQGGIAFKGKRVDLSVQNIMDYEKTREGSDNKTGRRFWGPKGNLKVKYFSSTRRVDPNGDASVTLSEADRELGDEADAIDANGKPVDVKTIAFILVVKDGTPSAHSAAAGQVDTLRRAWQEYGNGPATGGRGKFDTSLHPATH